MRVPFRTLNTLGFQSRVVDALSGLVCLGGLFRQFVWRGFFVGHLWGVAFTFFTDVRAFALPAAIHLGIVSRL